MNKIYRIIWSKVKNSWVVVSEIAKRNGKAVGGKTGAAVDGGAVGMKRMLAARVACSLLLGAAISVAGFVQQTAWAGEVVVKPDSGKVYFYGSGVSTSGNSSAWGYQTTAGGNYSTAFGLGAKASGEYSTAWPTVQKITTQ